MSVSTSLNKQHRRNEPWDTGLPRLARNLASVAFMILLGTLVLAPWAEGAAAMWSQGIVMGAVALATICWVVSLCIGHETQVVFSTLNAPVLVLMTYGIVRYSLAEVESLARPHMMLIITLALVFFVMMNTFRRRWQMTALVWAIVATGVLQALLGFWQVLRGSPARPATGTFPESAMLAVYLHLAFAVAGAYFLFSRRTTNEKIVFAFAGLITVVGLALAQSYWSWPGWVAAASVLMIYLLRRRGWRFRWVLLGGGTVLLVIAAAILAVGQVEFVGPEPTEEKNTPSATASAVQTMLSLVRLGQRHLVTGAGPGMTDWLLPAGAAPATASGPDLLVLFAEYGVIGLGLAGVVAVSLVMVTIWLLALRAARYSASTDSNRYAFGVAGLAVGAAILLDAALATGVRAGANLLTFAALAACALTCGIHHHGGNQDLAPKLGQYSVVRLKGLARYLLVGGLVAFVCLLISRLHYTYPAHLLVQLAERKQSYLRWGQAEAFYHRAWGLDSRDFTIAEKMADLFAARSTWNATQRTLLCAEAIRWYDRSLTHNPFNFDAVIKKARIYDVAGNKDKALEYFQQAVAARPRRAAYQTELGLHHLRWQDTEAARKAFQQALKIDPADERAALQLQALTLPAEKS